MQHQISNHRYMNDEGLIRSRHDLATINFALLVYLQLTDADIAYGYTSLQHSKNMYFQLIDSPVN